MDPIRPSVANASAIRFCKACSGYTEAVSTEKKPLSQPENEAPKGYQPSLGRKLLMFALCIVGLIIVWTYYFRVLKH